MTPVGLMAVSAGLVGGLALAGVLAAAGAAWFVTRRQPERRLAASRRRLERGDHVGTLNLVRRMKPGANDRPQTWHDERRRLEGECLYAASEADLRGHHFAEALVNYRAAAALFGLSEADATRRVVEAMLAEVRRLSAADPENAALPELAKLVHDRQAQCPEVSFWLGLYHLRRGDRAAGISALEAAHEATQGRQVDTGLYLGATWLRDGRPRDALRLLAEANRLAPTCPLVSWQLGAALHDAGGDALLAVRALQKALGLDGLAKYVREPHRLWADTLPADSWVRNLVQRAAGQRAVFRCPLGLDRVEDVLQSARLALAESLEACGRAADAVPIFTDLLKANDALSARRGLGLALAQLQRYDDALPHLRRAFEKEQPPRSRTAGALALCLAHSAGNRADNVRRALALLSSLQVRANADWARHAAAVFAIARDAGVSVAPTEIAELADILASTNSADSTAAAVYDLLAGAAPDAVRSECACLYVRAAQQQNLCLAHDEVLFNRAMGDPAVARAFFASREWEFEPVERLYLERWAERHAGSFPTAPGPGYAAEAEATLLADSRRLEGHNRPDAADAVARLALRLAPESAAVHDRLAELAYRRGEHTAAASQLVAWHRLRPDDPRPLARLALLAYQQNRPSDALTTLRRALKRSRGPARAPYAFLGARFALAAGRSDEVVELLDECLTFDADHPGALACRAALASARGHVQRLKGLADRMVVIQAEDPWFHYLTGICLFLTGSMKPAGDAARAAAAHPDTAAEGQHLLGLIRLQQNNTAGAVEALKQATTIAGAAAHDHAFALRGQAAWRAGEFVDAMNCWQAVPPPRRTAWRLKAVLPGAAFLAGLQALRAGRPEEASRWLRESAQLGHSDPRLESLLTAASLGTDGPADVPDRVISRLEQALAIAGPQSEIVRRLARAYRRQKRLADARRLLDSAPAIDVSLALERGLLLLAENQLVPAEKAFVEAEQHDPQSSAACLNLVFTRLSLGRLADATALLPRAIELAPLPSQQRLLAQLRALATGTVSALAGWSAEDDNAVLKCLRTIGRLDSVGPLFAVLSAARPLSPNVKDAQAELMPLLAKDRIDRGEAEAGRKMLEAHLGPKSATLMHNLLGICACLRQDFKGAARHFQSALPSVGDDARVQQNLAIVREWMGDREKALAHWRRFGDLHVKQTPKPAGVAEYHKKIGALARERLQEPTGAAV